MSDFTAGPVFMAENSKGRHEWILEFQEEPDDLEKFRNVLDSALQKVNTDYEAKRSFNLALVEPLVKSVPKGTFYQWMKARGKLGGQNKVPRLANNRKYLDEIDDFMSAGVLAKELIQI